MIAGEGIDPQEAKSAMIDSAIDAAEKMEVPNLVMGFKVEDPSLASAQVGRIAELLRDAMREQPELAELLKEREVDG